MGALSDQSLHISSPIAGWAIDGTGLAGVIGVIVIILGISFAEALAQRLVR